MKLRRKIDPQARLVERPPAAQKETQKYYDRYDALSSILDENLDLLDRIHKDIQKSVKSLRSSPNARGFRYTTDEIFRMILVQILEGWSIRETCVRIEDSNTLRAFTRIGMGTMMHYSSLCILRNAIKPETWKVVNGLLAQYAVRKGVISGTDLRLDTTAVETNIHYPTDSRQLSDCSRVLSRNIKRAREIDPDAVGTERLQHRRTKRTADQIGRATQRKNPPSVEKLRPLYEKLVFRVERTLSWANAVAGELRKGIALNRYDVLEHVAVEAIVAEIEHYGALTERVLDQTRRRVFQGEAVPSEEKVLSIFEPHTELLIRGKAGKRIEYGHMIQIQQVRENFITDYGVFEKRPLEPDLLEESLRSHENLFGRLPQVLAADKGYYPGKDGLRALESRIEVVSIAKKGQRTEEEVEREHDALFRIAQRFRAGIEGSISYLKRVYRLLRCFNKGWSHYAATIGATIFAHNLVVLARFQT